MLTLPRLLLLLLVHTVASSSLTISITMLVLHHGNAKTCSYMVPWPVLSLLLLIAATVALIRGYRNTQACCRELKDRERELETLVHVRTYNAPWSIRSHISSLRESGPSSHVGTPPLDSRAWFPMPEQESVHEELLSRMHSSQLSPPPRIATKLPNEAMYRPHAQSHIAADSRRAEQDQREETTPADHAFGAEFTDPVRAQTRADALEILSGRRLTSPPPSAEIHHATWSPMGV